MAHETPYQGRKPLRPQRFPTIWHPVQLRCVSGVYPACIRCVSHDYPLGRALL